jgi:hypothetical protein
LRRYTKANLLHGAVLLLHTRVESACLQGLKLLGTYDGLLFKVLLCT